MTALIGAALFFLSSFSFWYLLPTNGQSHWLFDLPGLDAYLPVFIVGGIALGFVMMFAAVL